jgi:alpha-beta hydrolase superfamily lysophospholipase
MLHGYTGWKEEEHIESLAAELASSGMATIRFDAPGSGESGGTWAEHYRPSNYLADVLDVVAYAKRHMDIDPERIVIWGHSMGGLIALTAAVRHPELFVAVCGSQPSSTKKTLDPTESKEMNETGWFTVHSRRLGDFRLPKAFIDDRSSFVIKAEIGQLKMPLLLIAGTDDASVPCASVKELYSVAPEPKQFLEYKTNHHYKKDPGVLKEINQATVAFFRKNLVKNEQGIIK